MASYYEIDAENSWVVAAAECNLPIVVPGWEDSTLGNVFASYAYNEQLSPSIIKTGIEYMTWLAEWYRKTTETNGIGFFQVGGGIAGDFPICVVPMLHQDLRIKNIPRWRYFCQISEAVTSYGGYFGAVPSEKITWGKA